jgi:hypothetical protein
MSVDTLAIECGVPARVLCRSWGGINGRVVCSIRETLVSGLGPPRGVRAVHYEIVRWYDAVSIGGEEQKRWREYFGSETLETAIEKDGYLGSGPDGCQGEHVPDDTSPLMVHCPITERSL